MKITDVKTASVRGNFEWILVRVYTDEGLVGLGECYWGTGVEAIVRRDLARLVHASGSYGLIREYSTTVQHAVAPVGQRHPLEFRNSNRLVANPAWTIGVSKTGYISEAGRCLVMQAQVAGRQVIIVLLDSWGTLTRIGDANRIKRWMESNLVHGLVSG